MSLALKLEEDNLQLVCQRSVEELHSLFVAWFQGTEPREGLTTALMECLAPDFSHVAPNGQFLQGRGILIGHLQDKYGCYRNRLFQIEIYDVRLLWHDEPGNKCLCTYEEWQSWLPDNAQQMTGEEDVSSSQPETSEADEGVHQFGRLSTCLLERKRTNNKTDSKYRWIHVHETWLDAESPQHEKQTTAGTGGVLADGASFMGEDTVATGPVEYQRTANERSPPNMLPNSNSRKVEDESSSSEETGVALPARAAPFPASGALGPRKKSDDDEEDDVDQRIEERSDEAKGEREDDDDDEDQSTSEGDEDDEFSGEGSGDPNERHLLMLMSTQSLSRDQMSRQDQARSALESSGIAFYEMDGANPEERENRNALFQLSGQWGRYPQFFLVDTAGSTTFWGDWDFFNASHSQGRLVMDIIGAGGSESQSNPDSSSAAAAGVRNSPPLGLAAAAAPSSATETSAKPSSTKHSPKNERPPAAAATIAKPAAVVVKAAPVEKAQEQAKERTPLAKDDGKLILLISAQTLSRDQDQRQSEMIRVLQQHGIAYETIDGSDKSTRERRNQLFRISTLWGKYPQIFHQNGVDTPTFWGTWDELQTSVARNTVVRDLKCIRPPGNSEPLKNESPTSSSTIAKPDEAPVASTATKAPPPPPQSGSIMEFEAGSILFLMSTQSLSKEQMVRQDAAKKMLREAKLEAPLLIELDGAARDYRQQRNELFKVSKLWGRYPQLFVVAGSDEKDAAGKREIIFWGDYAHMELCHNEGTLRSSIFDALGLTDDETKKEQNGALTVLQEIPLEDVFEDLFEKKKSPEQEFMEKSQGILEFEPDEDGDDENDEVDDSNNQAIVVAKIKHENDQLVLKTEEEKLKEVTAIASPIPKDVSSKRHVSVKLLKYAKPLTWENALVGLSLHGFDIGTSQGPIADETWYKEVTEALETVAQYRGAKTPRRKLTLPEMVYPTAHVALEGHGFWLSWDVLDAMEEWARAHADISIGSSDLHHGVGVLKSQDAKLWEKNKKKMGTNSKTPSVFHYDWSFSTPFVGKVEGGEWVELDESGMRVELLTDTSVPILFFDEITLFEDDLHDNGQVQFTVKIRVMPSCAYVLARLWLRVDNVVVRVRETRLLVDFFGMTPAIYRDVTWRECWWDSLKLHKLPGDVRSWHFNGAETPEWQNLLRKIPEVDPPPGVMKFATLEPNKPSRLVVKQLNSSVAEALSAGNASGYLEL